VKSVNEEMERERRVVLEREVVGGMTSSSASLKNERVHMYDNVRKNAIVMSVTAINGYDWAHFHGNHCVR
jgi:hypothetical protein